ncbi:MAG: hypothetical protein HY275_11690 [Gemmatimonadetes bacterium]|nr:hypothetical protein [Gemmatimonadota bacterium]
MRTPLVIRILMIVGGLARSAEPLAAQGATPSPLAAVAPEARAEMAALLDSAQHDGLPLGPLHAKIAEGVAKGADPRRIAVVLGEMVRALRAARAALGTSMSEGEWTAAAGTLQAGVTAAHLRELRASLPTSSALTTALVVLTDLVRRGVGATDGVTAIVRVARAGADDATLTQLRAQVVQDMTAGAAPRSALERRVSSYIATRETLGRPAIPVPAPLDP